MRPAARLLGGGGGSRSGGGEKSIMESGRQVANFGAGPAKLPRSVSRGRAPPVLRGAVVGVRADVSCRSYALNGLSPG